jgi:hypothetical protein
MLNSPAGTLARTSEALNASAFDWLLRCFVVVCCSRRHAARPPRQRPGSHTARAETDTRRVKVLSRSI